MTYTSDDLYIAWAVGFIMGNILTYFTLAKPAFSMARREMNLRHEQDKRRK